jgi:fatty acid desaturase
MLGAATHQEKARKPSEISRKNAVEWPTIGLTLVIYAGFGLVTWYYHSLPWWLAAAFGTYLVAWHGSLQHEIVHGHPTAWRRLNEALAFPSLWLWIPYGLYRKAHLRHHCDARLTDPLEDPESNYLTPQHWASLGRTAQVFYLAHNSFLGRLLLGPPVCVWRLYSSEARQLCRGNFDHLGIWCLHAASCALVLYWVIGVCGIPLVTYLALFVYPGIALSLVRSFAEHRAHPGIAERTVIVEAGPVMSLLFLHNNLHALHHAEPALPWYRLPARFKARRGELLSANGGYRFSGYGEILLRYFLWPKEQLHHPYGNDAGGSGVFGDGGNHDSDEPAPQFMENLVMESPTLEPVSAA